MIDYMILAEKSSAAKKLAQALGGNAGTFDGHSYEIVHARGHLLTLDEPENLVASNKKEQYASWSPQDMPWDLTDFDWGKPKVPIKGKNLKTGKVESTQPLINNIKKVAGHANAIVIATDNDPSGEGELLAWEIINAIDWHGKVLREYHDDESEKGFQKAMRNMKDVSIQSRDGDYVKANVRAHWDYLSMQLTRLSTSAARDAGYSIRVAPQGRLKSVMVALTRDRLEAIKNYVKKPYYEAKFKDENGHVFARHLSKNDDAIIAKVRLVSRDRAETEATNYHPSKIGNVARQLKKQAPGKLLDLSKIDGILSKKGYSSTTIKDVYQTLYEAKYLSYPRTEDTFITNEQFNELVSNADRIATLVGVDIGLLTHRQPRAKQVRPSATHGANRPGSKIPNSLNELDKMAGKKNVGTCAQDLYVLVAKSALTMLAEDYEYEKVSAELVDYPQFKTTFSIPKHLNYKLILNESEEKLEAKDKDLGTSAAPFVYEGANPKPSAPTKDWIYRTLSGFGSHGIGTGATQLSTMADITNAKGGKQLLNDKRGKLSLTETGELSAILAQNTYIASPQVTVQLFDGMDAVGEFKKSPDVVLRTIEQVVNHDKPVILGNVKRLAATLGQPKPVKKKAKATVTWKGKTVSFSKQWSEHVFTEQEISDLAAGKEISFKNKGRQVTGTLAKQTYRGNAFVGFKIKQ